MSDARILTHGMRASLIGKRVTRNLGKIFKDVYIKSTGESVTIQELSFNRKASDMPWVPENASDYDDWSSGGNDFGTFISDGERYGFIRINAREDYSHYLVAVFPDNDEMNGLRESLEVKGLLKEYLSESDRHAVHIFRDDVDTSFLHGPRFCKPCIVCSKSLVTVNNSSQHVENQPFGGTNFKPSGHYGSTVFDPNGSESISINICDECLSTKAKEGFVTHIKERKRVVDESIRTDWDPAAY